MLIILLAFIVGAIFVSSLIGTLMTFVNSRDTAKNAVVQQHHKEAIERLTEIVEYNQSAEEEFDESAFHYQTPDGKHQASTFQELMQKIANDPEYGEVSEEEMEDFRNLMEGSEDGEGWKKPKPDEDK